MSKHGSYDTGPCKTYCLLEMKDYRINLPLGNDRATTAPYERSASTWDIDGLKEWEKSDTSNYYKVYVSEIQMEVDPTSFKALIRALWSVCLSKW